MIVAPLHTPTPVTREFPHQEQQPLTTQALLPII